MQWLYRSSVVVIILFGSCVGSFVVYFVFSQLSLRNNSCSTQNTVYQAMKKMSATEWYSQSAVTPVYILKTDTRYYPAQTYGTNKQPSLVYVITGTDRDGLRGSEGFLYLLPDQSIPQYWFDNYWITHLNDNVYCYTIRGF